MQYAVIIGSSGLVGRQVLHLLAENPRYQKVISLGRRHIHGLDSSVTQEVIDFSKLSDLSLDLAADTKVDGFCCLGTTRKQAGSRQRLFEVDHDYVVQFAQLMWRYQARHISILSSIGASPHSISHYARTKALMEQDIKQIGLSSVSIMRPSLLLGKRQDQRFFEDLAKSFSKLMIGPLARWAGIEAFDVAKAMLAMAEQAAPGFRIHPSWEMKEIAAAY